MHALLRKSIRKLVPPPRTDGMVSRFAGRLRRKSFREVLERKEGYFSQNGQDRYLDESVFRGREKGTFVDIGANDGVSLSNTYFFETIRGWTGICVEPQPGTFSSLLKSRKCTCVQGCVTDTSGTAQFLNVSGEAQMLSGLCSKFDPRHRERIDNAVRDHGGATSVIQVPCFTFQEILEKGNVRHIDYLSIDTEGGELDILNSINFASTSIDVISVENSYCDWRHETLLQAKGYDLLAVLGDDEIYRRRGQNPTK